MGSCCGCVGVVDSTGTHAGGMHAWAGASGGGVRGPVLCACDSRGRACFAVIVCVLDSAGLHVLVAAHAVADGACCVLGRFCVARAESVREEARTMPKCICMS